MHESEKWKWSLSVVSDPQRPHGLQPSWLLRPWDFPGKSTWVGCHCLLRQIILGQIISYGGKNETECTIWMNSMSWCYQDFCICQRVRIFSEQLYPDLLIPKIQEKEYCLYIREVVVLYCDTTPLYLLESEHKSLCMLGPLTIVPHHFLLWWLSTDEEICLLNMIFPFLAHLCPNTGCCEAYKYLAIKV